MPTLAYLGPEGTNAEIAALTFADRTPCTLVPHHSIQGTLRAVLQREVEWAIVPVENSIEGGVGLTLDCLWNWEGLHIHSAVELPITHALLGVGELRDITHVYSHPQALAQCQGWLELYIPKAQQIPMTSTSVALDLLPGQPQLGAIAAPRAARLKNLPILAQPINDYPDNRTRFWVVGGVSDRLVGERLSIAFSPQKRGPGVLVRALEVFAQRGINLTRIESRPSKKILGEYVFFIDIEGNPNASPIQTALTALAPYCEKLKLLGAYTIRHGMQATMHGQ